MTTKRKSIMDPAAMSRRRVGRAPGAALAALVVVAAGDWLIDRTTTAPLVVGLAIVAATGLLVGLVATKIHRVDDDDRDG